MARNTYAVLVLALLAGCEKCENVQISNTNEQWAMEKPGVYAEEKIETADMHGGKFAVFEYEFRARGPEHPLAINGEDWGPRGSDVAAKWHIEWPEEGAGLSGEALMKVRKRILKMASGDEAEQSEAGQEGAGEADIWRKVAALKARAMKEYKCNPEEEYHLCSRWEYIADIRLEWPFGQDAKAGAEWYGRPVICVRNDGYSNNGGNGCHTQYAASVFSVPDGRELGPDDYFAADTMDELAQMVTERLYRECLDEAEAKERSQYSLDLKEVHMLVTKEGIKWTWDPYSILAGCYGAPAVTIPWEELAPFRK